MLKYLAIIILSAPLAVGACNTAKAETDGELKQIIMNSGSRCDEVIGARQAIGGATITCKVGINEKDYHVSYTKGRYYVRAGKTRF